MTVIALRKSVFKQFSSVHISSLTGRTTRISGGGMQSAGSACSAILYLYIIEKIRLIIAIIINPALAGGSTLGLNRSLSATILVCPRRLPMLVPQSYIGVAKNATTPQKKANIINVQDGVPTWCIAAIGPIHINERGGSINHQMFIFSPCRT